MHTLDKVVIDVGKKDFSTGLTFVACSRVRHLQVCSPFPFQRLASLANSRCLMERQEEDIRLPSLLPQPTSSSPPAMVPHHQLNPAFMAHPPCVFFSTQGSTLTTTLPCTYLPQPCPAHPCLNPAFIPASTLPCTSLCQPCIHPCPAHPCLNPAFIPALHIPASSLPCTSLHSSLPQPCPAHPCIHPCLNPALHIPTSTLHSSLLGLRILSEHKNRVL